MRIWKFLKIIKKCFGDARWSRYLRVRDKFEVFKILYRLSLKTEIEEVRDKVASQKIFEFNITGSSYKEILYLFREIFMENQYSFTSNNNSPKIIDCGANIGMAVLFFKRLYPDSTIIAFEPNPEAFKFLKKNLADNKLKNIEIFNFGLSNKEGILKFYIDNENSLISSLDSNRGGETEIQIETVRLSKFLKDTTFDLAKIDVEGSEWDIQQDLDESHSINKITQYIVEYHHNMKNTPSNLSGFLKIFEVNGFDYNLSSSYYTLGSYQDISIHFYKKTVIE